MELTDFDFTFVEALSALYNASEENFSVDPLTAPPRKQKKIRVRIEKGLRLYEDLQEEATRLISTAKDADFLRFAKACRDHIQSLKAQQKQDFLQCIAKLSEDVRTFLCDILEDGNCTIRQAGSDAVLLAGTSPSLHCALTLQNATGLPEDGTYVLYSYSLSIQDGIYCLTADSFNYTTDQDLTFAVRFTDAACTTTVFRVDDQLPAYPFSHEPWQLLCSAATAIVAKQRLSAALLNDREREMLPLLTELHALNLPLPSLLEEIGGFPLLSARAEALGFSKIVSEFSRLERTIPKHRGSDRMAERLKKMLNKQKYEPLWRSLFTQLTASQDGYPSRLSSEDAMQEVRNQIQSLLESHGYRGQYPDFLKEGPLREIRLVESYGQTYWVGAEKHAAFHIHCTEIDCAASHKVLYLDCGTELLKKGRSAGDWYSCLFDGGGRCLADSISCECGTDGKWDMAQLEEYIQVAVKRAERKKLTKEERKFLVGVNVPTSLLLLSIFLVAGGLFAVFMTGGMMLLAVLFCLLVGQPHQIPAMFTNLPWLALFLLSWGLFGGAMGIVTVLAKKR